MTPARASTAPRRARAGMRLALFAIGLVLFLWAALWVASLMSDSARIPAELAAAAQENGVMVCSDGTIVRADGSLLDRIFGIGRFSCTAWRMRARLVDPATGTVDWPSSPRR
ncbi:MAG: hypothetical protein ABI699_19995 [Caldimonas sp.]